MRKLLTFIFLAAAAFILTACSSEQAEIALVTDVGTIDDESFNQASWLGVKRYAEENNKTYRYYQPKEDNNEARKTSIRQAVKNGAKIIVCPGFMFDEAITELQNTYPDIKFVFVDGVPEDIQDNVYSILFKEEQAGFLAGYAAVKEGYRKHGFLGGMAVPAVVRFGYGYVQGANAAAIELEEAIQIEYWYGNAFAGSPTITAKMETWYEGGTEVVFACGGGIYTSALEAAVKVTPNGKVIGVDVDQSSLSELIITSAMKGLEASVYESLKLFFDGEWDTIAGKVDNLGLQEGEDFVGLPTSTTAWRFENFTKANYQTLLDKIIAGDYEISNAIDVKPTVNAEFTTVNYID